MRARVIRRSSAVALVALVLLCSGVASASAITRAQVLTRAQTWIDHPVPYSQAKYYGGYRTDCSGYVSMCWNTSTPGYVTATMHDIADPIAAAQLRPGDVLLRAGYHVRLFVGWADAARTQYVCWEQTPPQTKSSVRLLKTDLDGDYEPYRYNKITESDIIRPTTSASVAPSYSIIAMIRLAATDNVGGSGVAHTYYKVDGGAICEGTAVNVRAPGNHTVEYWSVDRMCNEESPHKTASFSVTAAPLGMLPVFRFYNPGSGAHFYTASGAECDSVLATMRSTYTLDGVAYVINTANADNDDPLYRFYNKSSNTHFYTSSADEKDAVIAQLGATYTYEGPAYNVCTTPVAGAMPVYRFYNLKRGTHFYTASEAEKDTVATTMASTYRLEGTAFYVAP